MTFALPLAAILLLPALLAWWFLGRHGHGRWWRLIALILLVAAATGPGLRWGDGGSDVVLILDRSASMPMAERSQQEELLRLVADQRRRGDRLAVVAVGTQAAIAQRPAEKARPRLGDAAVDPLGSAIGEGLETALALIPPGRSGRVLLHSDGDHTDGDPLRAAARLAAAGIPVDVLTVPRPNLPDAAIVDLELPGELRLGMSFIGALRVLSDRSERRRWRILRDDQVIASGELELSAGTPAVATFADRPPRQGLARYVAEIEGADGFARAATIDPQVLAAKVRALGDGALGQAAEALGLDTAKLLADLNRALADPAVGERLNALADPETRRATLDALKQQIAAHVGDIGSGLILSKVESILAESVRGEDDRQPLNNRARGAIRLVGSERILVMSGDGTPGNVSRALEAAGLQVALRREGPIDLADLAGAQALVLDNVPADRLGLRGLDAIAHWTEHLGGGLVLLGGRRSFGAGGYHRSAVEDVLPVTLELRDEHRKLACAIAIAIDVSGSMSMPVADGRIKLDLAAEGAAAVVELLGPRDSIAVFAVDSAPTTVLPLQRVDDPVRQAEQIRGIQPGGGGIFVYEALAAAGQALLDSGSGTRHLVLFSDAADSEEPGDFRNLLADYAAAGITVSVIGLGNERDVDAALLLEVAQRGGGRCTFAEAAEDIPRLFAQETMLVARSAWIDQQAPLSPQPAVNLLLGNDPLLAAPWPQVSGYNLTYPRERAQVLAFAEGDPRAPAVAAWRIGTGRSAIVTTTCDGEAAADLIGWQGYAPLLASLVRWCVGSGQAEAMGTLQTRRLGRDAVIRLELDPERRADWPTHAPRLAVVADGGSGRPAEPILQPVEDGVWEARHPLTDDRPVLAAAEVGGQALISPAVCLPYPAEAEPRFERRSGGEILETIARSTGGRLRSDVLDAYANPPSPGQRRDLATLLMALALGILVTEILVRRLCLGLPQRRKPAAAITTPVAATVAPTASAEVPAATRPATPADAPAAPDRDQGLHEALRQLRKKR